MVGAGDSDMKEKIAEAEEGDEVSGHSKRLKTRRSKSNKSSDNKKLIDNRKSRAITISDEKSDVGITPRRQQTFSIEATETEEEEDVR